jgi:hypothetical protein
MENGLGRRSSLAIAPGLVVMKMNGMRLVPRRSNSSCKVLPPLIPLTGRPLRRSAVSPAGTAIRPQLVLSQRWGDGRPAGLEERPLVVRLALGDAPRIVVLHVVHVLRDLAGLEPCLRRRAKHRQRATNVAA